jgi:uncharacterized protein YbjT (DUF2867 family)
MNQPRRILVTGGTGKTGSRVAQHLTQHPNIRPIIASRTPDPHTPPENLTFDWYETESAERALRSGRFDAVYLVAPARDPDPARAMTPLLETARAAGIERAVLLGAKPVAADDPGLGRVYGSVSRTFPQWAILRPSWFMQDFVTDHYLATMVREGVLQTASARGQIAYIDADDIGATAAALLAGDEFVNGEYILTGPQALTAEDVAATVTEALGDPVGVEHVSEAQLADRLARTLPAALAAALAHADATYTDTDVTDTVLALTGRPPRSLHDFLAATKGEGKA